MKILIVGHSVVDVILSGGGIKSESAGGIHYSVAGVSSVISEEDEISLLSAYSYESLDLFGFQRANVQFDFSPIVAELPKVFLNLDVHSERKECYNRIPEKLNLGLVQNFQLFDGILLNMITGFDIDLEDLEYLRGKFSGPIYLDVHTLARGFDDDGLREFRRIPDIEKWISQVNIVQVNESELSCISGAEIEKNAADEVLSKGPSALVITKGKKGASVYFNTPRGIDCEKALPEHVQVVSTVGCGDVFGAVFFYEYLSKRDWRHSLSAANNAAALAAKLTDKTKLNLN